MPVVALSSGNRNKVSTWSNNGHTIVSQTILKTKSNLESVEPRQWEG